MTEVSHCYSFTAGGASFQGFPPRSDYRPDSYQGYNTNGFGGSAPFQKRGGAGGPGFPRGGNSRGAGGEILCEKRGGSIGTVAEVIAACYMKIFCV